MGITARRDLYPLVHSIAFLEIGLEDGVRGLSRWLEETGRRTRPGHRVVAEEVQGPLDVALRRLDPLSTWADRMLVVPAAGDRWTAWFRNTPQGTDPEPSVVLQAQFLGVQAVAITDRPAHEVAFASYLPGEEDLGEDLEAEREVSCTLAGTRSFHTAGEPPAWEDTSSYASRDLRTCFGREQLHALCAGFGIDLRGDDFFAPEGRTVLLHRVGAKPGEVFTTLVEHQAAGDVPT